MVEEIELDDDMDRNDFSRFIYDNNDIIIFKFGAEWCNPCLKIKPYIKNKLIELGCIPTEKKIKYCEINVDDNIDIYSSFKKAKMIKGIPHMLCYFGENNERRSKYYLADITVSGSNEKELDSFFNLIISKL